jgi:DNA-binding transcriptional LysR family regulator
MIRSQQLSRERLSRMLYVAKLNYFVAVAQAGSIREASRRLNISASAVSKQLVQLEGTIGTPLFDRIGRKLRISPAGTVLLRHCESTLRDLEEVVADIDALQGLRTGTVRTATVESFSVGLLPRLVTSFAARFPLIHLEIAVLPASDVANSVADGKADIGFAFNPGRAERFTVHLRHQFGIGAVVAKNHPLASARLNMAKCLQYPVVLPAVGLSIRATLDTVLARHAGDLRNFVETTSLRFMLELALEGTFVTFQTRLGIERMLKRGSLVFLELPEPALRREEFAVITDARNAPRLAAAAFLEHALSALPRLLRI